MKKTKLAVLGSLLLCSAPAFSDVIGATVEASYWQGAYSGQVVSGSTEIDLENDLGFDDSGFLELAVSVEHPVPVLPNVRIEHIDLDETANGSFTATFNNVSFTGDVTTNLDLTHSDVILYYEVLDNIVMLDVGLNVKVFDGNLRIENESNGDTSDTKIDEFVPMLYAAADAALPFTGLSVGAELSAVKYSDNSLMDGKIRVRQGFGLAFLELGYRQMSLEIEDVNDIDVDADISGAYISTGLDF
ncbi:MAG: TIGR04219 family outer membrane beta-barrel protein [Reinekea sp.]|nr:TIGR04219 family outer membrane beta-barrel protein [Reinekea sp.]